MAQVKILKSNGADFEENVDSDDITLASYTVAGGGPVLSATGLDLNNQDVSDVNDLSFNDPSTGTINQTAGSLIVDNVMAKDRNNSMTTTSAILFPFIVDVAGQVDSFKIPHITGAPTTTPAFSSDAGYLVYDQTNKDMYAWDGAAWDNLNTVSTANNVDNLYTAEVIIAARDVVYISSADNVSPARADADATREAMGFATAGASAAASVSIRSSGIVTGFTGLTAGARYYVSEATAGAITATPPNGAGQSRVKVGQAKSATALNIQFDYLGKQA